MPATDLLGMLDAVILNVLMTNVDSHAKNYSILLTHRGARLAPLYDLMAGDAWSEITPNMAQDIGGQRVGRHIQGRHRQRFARECGLTPRLVIGRVKTIMERASASVDKVAEEVRAMPTGGHSILDEFVAVIKARIKTVGINLADG